MLFAYARGWCFGRYFQHTISSFFPMIALTTVSEELHQKYLLAPIYGHYQLLFTIINQSLKSILLPPTLQEQQRFIPAREHNHIEKSRECNTEIYLGFMDYPKAFENVKWNEMWHMLEEMYTPEQLIQLLNQLHVNSTSEVTITIHIPISNIKRNILSNCSLWTVNILYIVFDLNTNINRRTRKH